MEIYIICVCMFLFWLFFSLYKKKILTLITFTTWGIYFPLFLYQLNWSSLIDTTNCVELNLMMFTIGIIIVCYTIITANIQPMKLIQSDQIIVTSFGKKIAPFLTILFIFLYLLENYMGSGTIIPGLKGIDIHNKYSAPIISYITNACFLFVAFNFIYYKSTGKKRYLFYALLIIAIPIVTRSSRMVSIMTLLQLLVLAFILKPKTKKTFRSLKKNFFRYSTVFLALLFLGLGMLAFTNYRMSGYGKYDITYDKTTKWTGPEWLRFASAYYGYFPLSFNNLKINLLGRSITHNYVGLYSFSSLYFGILQFDNIFGISGSGAVEGNLITSGAANVPTGFWEYYYDFGMFFFVPFIVALIILFYFTKKCYNSKTVVYRVLFVWYLSYFAFMSFQNTLFMPTSIVAAVFIYIIIKKSFYVGYIEDCEV